MNKIVWALSQPSIAASLPVVVLRQVMRRLGKHIHLPLDIEVTLNTTERPAYAYCLYYAAALAKKLGMDAISALEFGVAGGNGLVFLDRFAARVEHELGVRVEVYGFDTGEGLPEVGGPEDMPYWFRPSQYRMDVGALRSRLTRAKLVLGDVRDTVGMFFKAHKPAPVGAMLNDLDLYTSTAESLRIFDHDPANFLPRVFMYFDDVIGSEREMYSDCNGELLAISDFNKQHDGVHIGLNQNLLPFHNLFYRYQIYYAHLIRHPMYSNYVGVDDQKEVESLLKLKGAA